MLVLLKRAKIPLFFLAAILIAVIFWQLYSYTSPQSLSYYTQPEAFYAHLAQIEMMRPSAATEFHIVTLLDVSR